MRVAVGLSTQLRLPPEELTALAGEATRCGYDRIWTHTRTVPDSFHVCESWWAESVRHRPGGIEVAVGVLPAPQYWTPAGLAIQAATSAVLTEGRFTLGLGTGGYGAQFWQRLGLPNRPIAVMRDYVEALRAIFAGGPVDFEGVTLRLDGFALDETPPPVPIYLAALGPQMLRLAGACADGVLLNWASPSAIAESRRLVDEGAAAAGRDRRDVTVAMYLRCAIDDDVDRARRVIASEILRKLDPSHQQRRAAEQPLLGYRGQFVRLGFESEIVRLEQRFAAGATLPDLLDEVSPELCGAAGYYGPAADAPARVIELAEGLDEVVVWVVSDRGEADAAAAAIHALTPERVRAATP